MSGFGNFVLSLPDEKESMDILDFEFDDDFSEFLSNLQASDLVPMDVMGPAALSNISAIDGLPPPESPSRSTSEIPSSKRFKSVTEDEIRKFEDMNQSDATKRNTKWGMKIMKDWHKETYYTDICMTTITADELAEKLAKFYCEAKPKDQEKQDNSAGEYHKNSLKNIRAAINRHLSDIGRDIDVVKDPKFKNCNKTLNGLLKERMTRGASRPTQHKEIINQNDFQKINTYLETANDSPIGLRLAVWFLTSIHFLSRGLEFHFQLNIDSFEFKHDENNVEYACLSHETRQKNWQGGLSNNEPMSDKRMYATGASLCPVRLLKEFINKTDDKATRLFNTCVKEALNSPKTQSTWYTNKALGKSTFTNFLPDICKQAGCSKRYTAHCLRASCIQSMSDAGFETRKILFMSGHKNEASVRSYSRDCSTAQKRSISASLTCMSSGHDNSTTEIENNTLSVASKRSTVSLPNAPSFLSSNVQSTSGMLTNSTFENCTFNIKM